LGFGKRLVINSENIDFKVIKQEDIVEVVDYDPVRNIVLAIGKKDPCYETPVHWMVQNARNDVNAVFQINSGVIFEQLRDDLPVTRSELPYGSVELAKEILRTLREGKHILLKNVGMVMVGFSLKEITDSLSKMELLKHQRGFSSESRRERV
jgi:ribulose-5-phosphate 4-epimerase/fuculose-1-phosphate aldolase